MYIIKNNEALKKYDIYFITKKGEEIFDCSFNLKEKAEKYIENMN